MISQLSETLQIHIHSPLLLHCNSSYKGQRFVHIFSTPMEFLILLVSRFFLRLCVLTIVLDSKIFAVQANSRLGFSTSNGTTDELVPYTANETASIDAGIHADLPNGSGSGDSNLCSTDLKSFLPPPYNAMASEFACKPIWNTFTLSYTQSKDNMITIVLSAVYTTGWIGIGFSKNGMMVGSSAMVGWYTKDGNARIKQYYLQGTHQSQVIADKGELPLTNIPPTVVLYGPSIYLAFQLKFDTPVDRQPIILAFGTKYPKHHHLTHHVAKTSMIFDFSTGSASESSVSDNFGRMKKAHGTCGLIGWGLVLPVGAMISRYLRHNDPLWYYLHTVIQFAGFIIILAGVVVGQQLYSKAHIHVPAHRGLGIFALVLCILQILAFFLRPNKDAKSRRYWNLYHHWFGRLALFFGAVNVLLGIQVGDAGNDWKIGYGFLVGTVLILVIILEILRKMRLSRNSLQPPSFQMNATK